MADKSGLKIGDQIIQVENTRFEQTTDDQALNLLKNLTSKKYPVFTFIIYILTLQRLHHIHSQIHF